jgi:hypothetical protein
MLRPIVFNHIQDRCKPKPFLVSDLNPRADVGLHLPIYQIHFELLAREERKCFRMSVYLS